MTVGNVGKAFNAILGNPKRKAVFVRFADYANEQGYGIYPSIARLAFMCEMSPRVTQRIVQAFLKEGIVTIAANAKGGRGRTRHYRLNMDLFYQMCAEGELACQAMLLREYGGVKGDRLAPFSGDKGCQNEPKGCQDEPERVTAIGTLNIRENLDEINTQFFNRFLEFYPRPGAPHEARVEFDRILLEGNYGGEDLVEASKNNRRYHADAGTEQQYILFPAKFLKRGDFEMFTPKVGEEYKQPERPRIRPKVGKNEHKAPDWYYSNPHSGETGGQLNTAWLAHLTESGRDDLAEEIKGGACFRTRALAPPGHSWHHDRKDLPEGASEEDCEAITAAQYEARQG